MMQQLQNSRWTGYLIAFVSSSLAVALFLLGLCLVAYGPFLPQLGFYWDDFPISWIAETMGSEGLERYFSTNRPFWGLIYQVTTPIIGTVPLRWQILALLLRWLTGVSFWLLIQQAWPQRKQLAVWSAALFVLYPGFKQQYISYLYSHFFIILNLFLLSLALTLMALRRPRRYWLLTVLALLASMANLFAMEYFFLLDLLRPVLVWMVLSETIPDLKQRALKTAKIWLPYLVVFAGAILWRSFGLGFQTYQPEMAGRLAEQPLNTLPELLATMVRDIWTTGGLAWISGLRLPDPQSRLFTPAIYWAVVAASGVISITFLVLNGLRSPKQPICGLWQPAVVGMLTLLVAGGPFWLTGLKIGLEFASDRFTLPFMIGACLVLASFLAALPGPAWSKGAILSILLALYAGLHFQNAANYRQDWSAQRALFWQMKWRIPDLKPGTLLLTTELPLRHYTDNSLTAPLNWMYDPNNQPPRMNYILYYITLRQAPWLANLQKNQPIEHDYLAARFSGSSSQVLVIYYQPPGCLRVLDSEIDPLNWMTPENLRGVLELTNTQVILPAPAEGKGEVRPPEHIYGTEPARGWCYYYEQAALARQFGDWEAVAALGDEGFQRGDYPNDPAERLPFIEGYAHTGNWKRAVELSEEARAVSPVMQAPLCRLWQRIERETGPGSAKDETLRAVQETLNCEMGN